MVMCAKFAGREIKTCTRGDGCICLKEMNMKLVRNTTKNGICKYSIIEHEKNDHVEHGLPNTENEFFVIKLKDKHAQAALNAYVESILDDFDYVDNEYAKDIKELADRSGEDSPWCKAPD